MDCTATSPPSHTTVRGYDDAHRLISVTDAEDHTTSFGYNANDELTSRTDAEGVTTIGYDQRGLPVTVTSRSRSTRPAHRCATRSPATSTTPSATSRRSSRPAAGTRRRTRSASPIT
ncbi:MAG: hypothetical protein KY469_06515 [Actinobacteria bacterium]|nr:hypothetical protein [Actinomycetota bacterium]